MKNRFNLFLGIFAVIATTHSAHAASTTWNGTTNVTWATTTNWSISPVPGTGDTATFNNAGNANTTIDLGAGVTIGNILFDTSAVAAYTIGSGAVNSQTLTLDNGGSITLSSTINNNQLFSAKLVLGADATAQSYAITNNSTTKSGTFAGTISGGSGGTAGAKTLNVSTAAGGITLSGTITNGGATSLALAFSGTASSITFGNAGSTYSGGTTIGNGVRLNVSGGSGKALGSGDVTVASGGQAYLNSTGTYANNFAISGTEWTSDAGSPLGAIRIGATGTIISGSVTLNADSSIGVDSGRTGTINGNITGAFNLTKVSTAVGTGSPLTLAGTNTYSGTTTITQGVISFAKQASLYNSNTANWTPTKISVASNTGLALGVGDSASGYWDAAGVDTFLGATQMGTSTTTTGFKTGSLIGFDTTNATSGTFTYNSAIGNIGTSTNNGLVKLGTGTLVLGGSNSYTGATSVDGGILTLASTGKINGSTVTINSGGTFSNTGGTALFSGAVTPAGGTFSQTSGTSSMSSVTSSGSTDLGLISITGGNFTVSTSVSLGRSFNSTTVPTLATPLAAPTTSGLYINGSTAAVNLGTNLNIGTANSSSSARLDAGSLTVTGTVTVGKTTSTSRYDVLQVNGGTFNAPDTTSGIVLAPNNGTNKNNAELYLSGGTTTAGKITFGASTDTVTGNGLVILQGGTLYVGSGGIVKASTTSGTNLYNYTVGLTSGTLGAAADWSSSLNMTLGTNPAIQAADSSGTARNITFSGVLSGTGLTKTGAGNLILAGGTASNTYTGAAVINAGSLILDNTTAAGGNNNTRIADGSSMNINGGSFIYKGADAASTNSTETVGAITSGLGGVITVTYGGTNLATLTGTSFVHTTGQASSLINGANLGKNSTDTGSVGKVILTNAPTLVGGTAALTSGINSAAQNTQIIPYFVGEATSATAGLGTQTGTANTFLTYIAGSGLRPLNPTDEFTNNAITAGNNTYITLATSATATAAINSLVINGGDLSIDNGQVLTDTSGALLFASSNAIKPTATSGALNFASGTEGQVYVNSGITGTISAAITLNGTNALTKSGAGTLLLAGANTYTGTTTVRQGRLVNGSATTFTNKGALSLSGSGIFDLGGYNASVTNVPASTANNTITNNGSSDATLTISAQATANISSLIKDGPTNKLTVNIANTNSSVVDSFAPGTAQNTFSGGLTLLSGSTRLRISSLITTTGSPGAITSSPFGTGAITIGGTNTDKAQILMDTVANNTLANDIIVNTALGTDVAGGIRVDTSGNILSGKINANLANARFTIKTGGSVSLTGQITGSFGLEVGTYTNLYLGTVTLNNAGTANDYGGDTTVGTSSINSVLALGRADQIPNGSGKGNVSVNGTLQLNGFNETINGLSGGSTGIVNGVSGTPTLTIGDNNATSSFSGVIRNTAGSLSLTKVGNGTLTLGGTNTYSGLTTVSAGTLAFDVSETLLGGLNVATSGTAVLTAHTGGAAFVKVLDIAGLTISGTTPFAGEGGKDFGGLVSPAPVPEPGTMGLLAVGAIGGLLLRRRRCSRPGSATTASR